MQTCPIFFTSFYQNAHKRYSREGCDLSELSTFLRGLKECGQFDSLVEILLTRRGKERCGQLISA